MMSLIQKYLDYVYNKISPVNDMVWSERRERNINLRVFLNDCFGEFAEIERRKEKHHSLG